MDGYSLDNCRPSPAGRAAYVRPFAPSDRPSLCGDHRWHGAGTAHQVRLNLMRDARLSFNFEPAGY